MVLTKVQLCSDVELERDIKQSSVWMECECVNK